MEAIKTNMELENYTDSGGGGSYDKSTTEDGKIVEDDTPDYDTAPDPGDGNPSYQDGNIVQAGESLYPQDGTDQNGNSGATEEDPVYMSVQLSASQKTPSGAKESGQDQQKKQSPGTKQSQGILAGITGTQGVLILLVVIAVIYNWKTRR